MCLNITIRHKSKQSKGLGESVSTRDATCAVLLREVNEVSNNATKYLKEGKSKSTFTKVAEHI